MNRLTRNVLMTLAVIASFFLGELSGCQEVKYQREAWIKDLSDCAKTHNIYQVPGTDTIIEAKRERCGLRIVRVESVERRRVRLGLNSF